MSSVVYDPRLFYAGGGFEVPEQMYVEDIDGVWHLRRDTFWDCDITADVRAHALCGDIWSCRTSQSPPSYTEGPRPRYCRSCFPPGPTDRARRRPA